MSSWPRLSSPRLHLRPMRQDDAPVLAAYRSDPAVAAYQSWNLPYTLADAEALIAEMEGRVPGDPGWVQLGLEEHSGGGLIGDVALNTTGHEAEVGVTLSATAQGKGYAEEALRVLLAHVFGPLGLERAVAQIDPRNVAVVRLLHVLGFRHLETQYGSYLNRQEWTDNAVYALLQEEWLN
jgi:RimJ/RimL family protein N-acetyltransferase